MQTSTEIEEIIFHDEDIMVCQSSNIDDVKFDQIIGHIEDIIMEPNFQQLQNGFLDSNYKHFEDTDENKLIYTNIHSEYVNLIEKYIAQELEKRIENFSMIEFMNNLLSRKEELDGEIFEILVTFVDFLEFKQLMLSHKAAREGKAFDLSLGLTIQSINFDTSTKQRGNSELPHQQQSISSVNLSISGLKIDSMRDKEIKTKTSTPLLDKTEIVDES